jgi:hypothetical protein
MERLTLTVSVASSSRPPSLKSPVETTLANFRYLRSGSNTVILDPETGQELHRDSDLWFKVNLRIL